MWRELPHHLRHEPFFSTGVTGEDVLFQEVFSLAYYLHWSREDILTLPILERRRYLELLVEQLQREQQTEQDTLQ